MRGVRHDKICTVTINIDSKENGVYISSDDVPGLWLWGNIETVYEDIAPTIRELYLLNQGRNVDVEPEEVQQSASERLAGLETIPRRFNIYEHKEVRSVSLEA